MGTNKIPKIVHCQEAYAFMYIGERSIVHAHLPARSRVRTTFFCLSTRLLPSSYVCPCVHIVSFVGPCSSGWSVARSRPRWNPCAEPPRRNSGAARFAAMADRPGSQARPARESRAILCHDRSRSHRRMRAEATTRAGSARPQ